MLPRFLRRTPAALLLFSACSTSDAAALRWLTQHSAHGAIVDRLKHTPPPPRTTTGRLTLDVAYRDCGDSEAQARVACASAATRSSDLQDIGLVADSVVRTAPTADALHAAALIDLAWDGTSPVAAARAVRRLRDASRTSDAPASILSDLAAAELVAAELNDDPTALLRALDAAGQAVEREPQRPQAVFNIALVEERLGLGASSLTAWRRYVQVANEPGWTDEARRHIATLEKEKVSAVTATLSVNEASTLPARDAGLARARGFVDALGTWADAELAADAKAATEHLDEARTLGAALVSARGDHSLADVVARIDAARSNERHELAVAHGAYRRAQERFTLADFSGAAAGFDTAMIHAGSSPVLRAWARVHRAAARVNINMKDTAAINEMLDVATHTDTSAYPALAGRASWTTMTSLLRIGRFDEGDRIGARASQLLQRAGEAEAASAVSSIRADRLVSVGDDRASMSMTLRAARAVRSHSGSVWRHNVLFALARAAEREQLPTASMLIRDEDATVVRGSHSPMHEAEALIERARGLGQRGERAASARDLAQAQPLIASIKSPVAQGWFRSMSQIAAASSGVSVDQRSVDSAIAFLRAFRGRPPLVDAFVARANSRIAADVAGAETDLDSALVLVGEMGRTLAPRERAALLRSMRETYARAVLMHHLRGADADALRDLERGRAAFSGTTVSVSAPMNTMALELLQVGDTLLALVVDGTGIRSRHWRVRAVDLQRASDQAHVSLESGANADAALAALNEMILAPVESLLRPGATLVIVADGVLADVPFAALRDDATHTYLVERHPTRVVGSLADAQPRAVAGVGATLFVADPAFDRRAFPLLDRLPGAGAEVAAASRVYPGARILEGAAATPAAVMGLMPGASLIHIAGHAIFDPLRPERSRIPLAADSGDASLTAESLAQLDLHRTRLVVLSSCESARAADARSASFPGFAQALLAAKVGGVVGSLWRVNDRGTSAAMVAFHSAYRGVTDPTLALQRAQLEMLKSPRVELRSPSVWGAFRYTGS